MLNAGRIALALLGLAAFAQAPHTVPITSEPSHHLVIENAWVRVFDVTVAPKASTLIHQHDYDYLFVTLGDSDVTSARVGEKPVRLVLKDGETMFSPGHFAHAAINNLDVPFHNITIELLRPSTNVKTCSQNCEQPVPCALEGARSCGSRKTRITSDQWTVTDVTLDPAAKLPRHSHAGPHLVVPVSELSLREDADNQAEREIRAQPGQSAWVPAGRAHVVTNVGNRPARLITLQFKDQSQ